MKRLRILTIVLAALVVIAHIGGGWYFSGVLETDLLRPPTPAQHFETEVVAVDDTSITLRQGERSDLDLYADGVYGIAWPGGYGQVGQIEAVDGTVVTREFQHLQGVLTSENVLADLESVAFPPDPAVLGRTFQSVQYESPLGPMDAWHVSGARSTWLVIIHGRGVSMAEGLRMLSAAGENPALLISYRNDPGQPSDSSGFYQYGRSEWADLNGAIGYAREHGAEGIVLVGLSTGAAIALSYLEQVEDHSQVVGLVFDAPNVDIGATVDHSATGRKIPGTPLPIPATLTATAKLFATWRFDVDWEGLNYVDRNPVSVPLLVLHGSDDPTVPVSTSERLAEAATASTELIIVDGARHVQSWNVDPDGYGQAVKRFLDPLG